MALIKTPQEISYLRYAGTVVGEILRTLKKAIQPGMTGLKLEKMALAIMHKRNCEPNFLHYQGFPAAICVSVNEVIIHGIPNAVPFQAGDLVSVDVGCQYRGYHADAALSILIGKGSAKAQRLLATTQKCLQTVIQNLTPGKRVGWIGATIQKIAESAGFYLNNDYAGHGIGSELHEPPTIYNRSPANKGIKLMPGMVICVEPMLLVDSSVLKVSSDRWSVFAPNRQLNCHFEHMLFIGEKKVEVLTAYEK